MINVIKRFFDKIAQKRLAKIKAKQQEAFKKAMNQAYNTLKWIEKQLPNRKSRKQFYTDILYKGFIHSRYLDMFMSKFINRDEVVITKEDFNFLQICKRKTNQK